jgi:hypothetical protein
VCSGLQQMERWQQQGLEELAGKQGSAVFISCFWRDAIILHSAAHMILCYRVPLTAAGRIPLTADWPSAIHAQLCMVSAQHTEASALPLFITSSSSVVSISRSGCLVGK